MEKDLPFKSKAKVSKAIEGKSLSYVEDETFLLKKLGLPHNKPLKAYNTEKEKNIISLLQRLNTIKNVKDKKTKQVEKEFNKKKAEEQEKEEKLKRKRHREKMIKNIKKKNK